MGKPKLSEVAARVEGIDAAVDAIHLLALSPGGTAMRDYAVEVIREVAENEDPS